MYIPYATHDILIYLFLINASLELEHLSLETSFIIFLFFIILSETVVIDPNVNRDISIYFRIVIFHLQAA